MLIHEFVYNQNYRNTEEYEKYFRLERLDRDFLLSTLKNNFRYKGLFRSRTAALPAKPAEDARETLA